MNIEHQQTYEMLADRLSLATSRHLTEQTLGIRMYPDTERNHCWLYHSPDETWLIEVFIPPDNVDDDQPEIIVWYDDAHDNSVIDSAINHLELNRLLNLVFKMRCRLAEHD
jgi:hypothetical protein